MSRALLAPDPRGQVSRGSRDGQVGVVEGRTRGMPRGAEQTCDVAGFQFYRSHPGSLRGGIGWGKGCGGIGERLPGKSRRRVKAVGGREGTIWELLGVISGPVIS